MYVNFIQNCTLLLCNLIKVYNDNKRNSIYKYDDPISFTSKFIKFDKTFIKHLFGKDCTKCKNACFFRK